MELETYVGETSLTVCRVLSGEIRIHSGQNITISEVIERKVCHEKHEKNDGRKEGRTNKVNRNKCQAME